MLELYRDDPLYLAVMADDEDRISELRSQGTVISDHIKYALTHAVGSLAKQNDYSWTCWAHQNEIRKMDRQKFIRVMRNLHEEIGEPMHYNDGIAYSLHGSMFEAETFSCILDCFDNKKINKKLMMHEIIKLDKTELLALAAQHGWLKMPRKRDEMIDYASDNNKTECLAWLLDFKNRTADLAEEQEKAEKKLMRELNASPDSVYELKKLWSYQKQEDGTLVITGCKRSAAGRTKVAVPEKIGESPVEAIGEYAFSPYAPRLRIETEQFRHSVTSISLPESIRTIAGNAFYCCSSLEEINIPDGVSVIEERTFAYCHNLGSIWLPASLRRIDGAAFAGSRKLTRVNIPDAVEVFGAGVFNGCTGLTEISIPGGVKEIGAVAFYVCAALEKVTLSEGLLKIGRSAFESCKKLKSIEIPDGVEEIDRLAFAGCEALEKIYLPRSLKKIKNQSVRGEKPHTVFHGCPSVTAVVYEGSYALKYCMRNNIPYETRK